MIERLWELHWEMPYRGRFCDRGAAKHASRFPNAATAVGTCESVTYLLVAPHKWIQRVQRHPIAIIISVGLSSSLRRPFWLKCLTGSCPRSNPTHPDPGIGLVVVEGFVVGCVWVCGLWPGWGNAVPRSVL